MKKLFLKLILPKPTDIAKTVAKAAADFVNSTGKQEAIATFIYKTKPFQDAQVIITRWLADGILDESEVKELEDKLVPVVELLFNKMTGKAD